MTLFFLKTLFFVNTEQILTVFDFGGKIPEGRRGRGEFPQKASLLLQLTCFFQHFLQNEKEKRNKKENSIKGKEGGLLSVFCKHC